MKFDRVIAFINGPPGDPLDNLRFAIADKAGVGGETLPLQADDVGDPLAPLFRGDIPERDVDAGYGEDGDSVATEEVEFLLQTAREGRNILHLRANHMRQNHIAKTGVNGGLAGIGKRLPPADCSVIRLKPQQHEMQPVPFRRHQSGARAAEIGKRDDEGDNVGARDPHQLCPTVKSFLPVRSSPRISQRGRVEKSTITPEPSPASFSARSKCEVVGM